ncbi:MAG TPA: hypothetical protein VJR89_43795 [Polyangiales bacterium]|nr:hypothetical protein [Polyangiales bacterium]
MAVHDANLTELWSWEDPAARLLSKAVYLVRLGEQVVVSARFVEQNVDTLLFFDAKGFVREVPSSVASVGPPVAFGPDLLVKQEPTLAAQPALVILDVQGSTRLRSSQEIVEGFNSFWVHAVDAPAGWTLVSHLDSGGLQWRRVALPSAATASVEWTHRLEGEAWRAIPRGAIAASGGDIVVWGDRSEQRENVSGGFPWIAVLGADGRERWQWSNAELVTPGQVRSALRLASGQVCALSDESWEYSRADPPQGSAHCAPEGCSSVTVRCFAPDGSEQWKYHHRSERSGGVVMAAAEGGEALYVAATIQRDPVRSTGTRSAVLKFEPSP